MSNNCCNSSSPSSNDSACGCGGNVSQNKMCQKTQNAFKFDVEEIKKLTSNPKHICKCCGRTANDKENLCSPDSL